MTSDPTVGMQSAVFLLLRRMRAPLVTLILAYATSITGLVLIPGLDPQGNPWRVDFFHAFYFVSFMGTTIGFGEIPYPFTGAQRLWVTISIYLTVVAWLYAIGSLFAVLQDASFRRVLRQAQFMGAVRRITSPFYLVCGYGDTGSELVGALAERDIQSVVIDTSQKRIDALSMGGLPLFTPGLCGDAAEPSMMLAAGLRHKHCVGVVALSNNDHINLKIAITSKLLRPKLKVICRAESHDTEANMASFGTDHIINPFDTFAGRFSMAIHSPAMYLIYEWMTSARSAALSEPLNPPKGGWVLCGYGRFGKAMQSGLFFEGVRSTIIEADPVRTRVPEGAVVGRGTEAVTLREANIEDAVGIIAGTDDDANNLSIIMTAKELNSELFTVARQNESRNDLIFESANIDVVTKRSDIIARKILTLIITPLLSDFLRHVRRHDNEWANVLASRISGLIGDSPPDAWTVTVWLQDAAGLVVMLRDNQPVTIGNLCADPRDRTQRLPGLPLMLKRKEGDILLPDENTKLQLGDQVLFTGQTHARSLMKWNVQNYNVLTYVCTGELRPSGYLWRYLARKARPATAAEQPRA